MSETTYFTSTSQAARHAQGGPHIAGTAVAFTPNRYDQAEVARGLTEFAEPIASERFAHLREPLLLLFLHVVEIGRAHV